MKAPRGFGALLALALVPLACGPGPVSATATPGSTGPEVLALTDKSLGEIQAVMTAQHDALERRDLKGYQSTYDGARPALRRCKQEDFDVAGRLGAPAAQRVLKVTPFTQIYARGWVDEGSFGIARYYFRKVDGKWVQTEPLEDELGPSKTVTVSDVGIDYWAIDDDVIEALSRAAVTARDAVVKNALSDLKDPLRFRFYPTRSLAGLQGCRIIGYHVTNAQQDKTVRFLRYWFATDLKQAAPYTIENMQHEGLHWLQDEYSPGLVARLDWWMTEGWPDYVAQSRSSATIKTVICTTPAPTMKELATGPRDDLPDWKPEDTSRYYAFANSMVEYLYAQFGGLSAYKQLLTVYRESADPNVNFPRVLKVTPDQFYAAWLAFAKKKYC